MSEAGEFAVRGGIVDLFPPGAAQPLRLDLFGDDVEVDPRFDPLSQRSTGKRRRHPVCSRSKRGPADDDRIERFRAAIASASAPASADDPLYEAVTAGRPYAGMEHWLPLFHERLVTLFDYLPGAAGQPTTRSMKRGDARLELIADSTSAASTSSKGEEPRRRPVPAAAAGEALPQHGRMGRGAGRACRGAAVARSMPPDGAQHVIDGGGPPGPISPRRAPSPDVNLFDAVARPCAGAAGRRPAGDRQPATPPAASIA